MLADQALTVGISQQKQFYLFILLKLLQNGNIIETPVSGVNQTDKRKVFRIHVIRTTINSADTRTIILLSFQALPNPMKQILIWLQLICCIQTRLRFLTAKYPEMSLCIML